MKTGRTLAMLLGVALSFLHSLPVDAQQPPKVYRVGLFHVGLDHVPPSLDGLHEGLKPLGYEEGKNIRLDFRNLADEEAARTTAQEFVRERVDVIVAFENHTVRAAIAATSQIPIVMLHVGDPVVAGYVKSFAHPGGNVTGYAGFGAAAGKQLQLFKELVPGLRRLLVLGEARDPSLPSQLAEVRRAAAALKFRLVEREVTDGTHIERVFSSLKRGDVDGVYMVPGDLHTKFHSLVLRLGSERRLPVAANQKARVQQGALYSYNDDFRRIGRASARYVDRILKGARPEDLPVEEVSQYEFVINLRTAKTLGLVIPRSVLLRADHVIEN